MKLQVKILLPILLVLILSFLLMGIFSVSTALKTQEAVLKNMDEKNIALAQSLAYIIAEDESNLEPAKMAALARLFNVDEVHVVDGDGILRWGNIEGFYGFDFRDGEQTRPLLEILRNPQNIAQEPQPRGTDNVMFQYISVPRIDEPGIVQVGVCMTAIDEIKQYANDALVSTIVFGIIAVLIVTVIITIVIRWIVRKIYWHENILDSIPFPISITDNDRNWTFINKAVENFLGKKRSQVVGQPCSNWGAAICKTEKCGIECLGRGKSTTEFTQKDMDFKVDSAYLTDAKNNRVGHIEVVQDITAMVALQKQEEKLVGEIEEISGSFVSTSKQIADGSQTLAQGSTEQAASVQELSASIADITDKTKSNAEMAGKAAALADTIKSSAEKGNRQMDEMINAVEEINAASQSISKVIKTIDDIAFQTNILALNAAVEAARAGAAGKGFSVVAEEVRNLASKSADAAKDTASLIENSMEKAEFGTRIAGETASSLKEIVHGINESGELIGKIADLSEEQSTKIEQINHGIDLVTQVIQQNSATAEELAAASEEMSGQASILDGMITRFKQKK